MTVIGQRVEKYLRRETMKSGQDFYITLVTSKEMHIKISERDDLKLKSTLYYTMT